MIDTEKFIDDVVTNYRNRATVACLDIAAALKGAATFAEHKTQEDAFKTAVEMIRDVLVRHRGEIEEWIAWADTLLSD